MKIRQTSPVLSCSKNHTSFHCWMMLKTHHLWPIGSCQTRMGPKYCTLTWWHPQCRDSWNWRSKSTSDKEVHDVGTTFGRKESCYDIVLVILCKQEAPLSYLPFLFSHFFQEISFLRSMFAFLFSILFSNSPLLILYFAPRVWLFRG